MAQRLRVGHDQGGYRRRTIWIWNLADQHFPGALQVVDLYHAREHLWKVAAWLHPNHPAAKTLWMTPMKDRLDEGQIEPGVARLREIAAAYIVALRCCRRNGRFEDYWEETRAA